ncbi:MAG: hypothetical protein M9954_08255 [Cyclobacteriaceae bacterium]|nr:hypothetical protein [Cyclobacteriaceae bacterium]MCB0498439.1 hypothetical protein [Cyclobacteriaceae bacterium]MCB9236991.1 hypothetical protein [Flammeovirgaceae bacterium]MCO5271637.1 hypothetical protein [Cyclobacteriaceae bacterium]MCW5901299.1 hypothetical protein [Cyclobacteriaceae bacterium]
MNRILPSILSVLLFAAGTPVALPQGLQQYYDAATEAYGQKDYKKFYENIVEANKLHPYHQVILYRLGIAAAHLHKREEALRTLRKAIQINAVFDLSLEDFDPIRDAPGFQSLIKAQQALQTTETRSDTAFTISDRTAHIESIAVDSRNGDSYLASIHKKKIIKRDKDGKVMDFTGPGAHGLTAVFDVQVDPENNWLWACASPMPEMENYDSTEHSALYKFDLKTGALVAKYESRGAGPFVFGDLALNAQGQAFVSDGKTNTIFVADEKSGTLQPFYSSEVFWNIQGIAFSSNGRYLFIADYIKGLFRLEVATQELTELDNGTELSLKGIDGLLYYNNSLVAIQNGVVPNRVARYALGPGQARIVGVSIIDKGHPAFNEPTMGCIANGRLYYVANSPWNAYDKSHVLQPQKTADLVILTIGLGDGASH